MIKTLFRVVSNWRRARRSRVLASRGYTDLSVFNDLISHYRNQGAIIGNYVRLLGRLDSVNSHLIEIGDYSVIGTNAALLSHCPVKGARPCKIGKYVYLGWGVIVLPGVSIGDFSIIGAGSVVTHDIPPGSIAAGNPAKIIRKVADIEKTRIKEIMENNRLFGWDPDRG